MNIRGWILVVVILLCIIFAGVSYNRLASRLPHSITIASGSECGAYHHLALQLKKLLRLEYPRITVEIQTTDGSADNLNRITEGKVQFAFFQNNGSSRLGGADGDESGESVEAFREVRAVANLYVEVLHIIVRKSMNVNGIQGLSGVNVSVGAKESGTIQMAQHVLRHYNMSVNDKQMHKLNFADTLKAFDSGEIDAAFIVTGSLSPMMRKLLGTGKYDLLPIQEVNALVFKNTAFLPFQLPRSVYSGEHVVPTQDTTCLAVKASLITHRDVPAFLVRTMTQTALSTTFRNWLRELSEGFAKEEQDFPIHRGAMDYYHRGEPTFSSSVAEAFNDTLPYLLVLAILVIVVGATLRQNRIEKRRSMSMRLHEFMTRIADIEADQRGETNPQQLYRLLDVLSRVKKRAVDDRVDGRLPPGDDYVALMVQLDGLINTIHAKLAMLAASDAVTGGASLVEPPEQS
ncbi:MAG: TAXI family TRAP transporter solute-binding subunit [Candidatus Poribacteria bacterium]|nr:TAXI family TRAP transporter solute-binding subunit [Candidatus Poribacteria bacterium]